MADESGDDRYETGPTIWELGGRRDGADSPLRVEVAERARGCGDARTDFEERPAICERRALGEQREGLEMGDTVKVLNVWADEQGVSHLREIEFDLKSVPPGGALSDPIKTT